MRRIIMMALAGAAISAATPAYAQLLPADPCHDFHVNIGGQAAIACVGYFGGNLLQGQPGQATPADVLTDLGVLLTDTPNPPGVQDHSPAYSPPYVLNVSTIVDNVEGLNGAGTFTLSHNTLMSGLTVLGLHFGNAPDAPDNNITAFFLFNLLTASNTITLTDPPGTINGQGSSNVQLYTTGTRAVPEAATWAMMLLGFGGIGFAMRRSRKDGRLLQIA